MLICHDTFAVIKKTNIQRHYNAQNREKFDHMFLPGFQARKESLKFENGNYVRDCNVT